MIEDPIQGQDPACYADEPFFSLEEYERRLRLVREGMEAAGLDVLIVSTVINIHYLTGYQNSGQDRFQCLLIPRNGEPHFVLRKIWFTAVAGLSWIKDGTPVDDTSSMFEATREAILRLAGPSATIGYDDQNLSLPPAILDGLRESLPAARFQPGSGLVERVRLIKSAEEMDCIRQAAKLSVAGLEAAIEEMRPGRTEKEVMAASYSRMVRGGSDYLSAQPIVVCGYRNPARRCKTEGRVIRAGTTVWYEGSAFIKRYGAPIMRTMAIGKPDPRIVRISDVMRRALDAILETAGPGVRSGDVDRAARGIVEQAGLGDYWIHRTGYSMGVSFPPTWGEGEIMDLKSDDPRILQPGMVFHTVPWALVPGLGCIGNSETWAVTEQGVELLTVTPRELRLVTVA